MNKLIIIATTYKIIWQGCMYSIFNIQRTSWGMYCYDHTLYTDEETESEDGNNLPKCKKQLSDGTKK